MKRYSKEERAMWVEDWEASGESIFKYARRNGLHPATLKKWTRRQSEGTVNFIELPKMGIETAVRETTGSGTEILIEIRDIKIHLPAGIDARAIGLIIQAAGRMV